MHGSFHLFFSDDPIKGKPNRAFYAVSDLNDKTIEYTVDTAVNRGLTPFIYFERNSHPLLVVNNTFFSLATRANLNVIVKNDKLLAFNVPAVFDKTDSLWHSISRSAIGIRKNRQADVAWLFTDSVRNKVWELKEPAGIKERNQVSGIKEFRNKEADFRNQRLKRWKVETAVGGGPALITNGKINITNNEERMFAGERINEKHPRTAMGYTIDGKLIILAVEGRFPGLAEGATLNDLARIMLDLGCVEALNLDGGGSSCMLINGKQTITPSDKTGQRPVPAVFIIKAKDK